MNFAEKVDDEVDCISNLRNLRSSYKNNVSISYINLNSLRYKVDCLRNFVDNNIDVVETKLDDSFSTNQFLWAIYKKPYRLDVSDSSGGLLTYVNSKITSR